MSLAAHVGIRAAAAALTVIVLGAAGLAACGGENQAIHSVTPGAVVEAHQDGFDGTVVDTPLRPADGALTDTHGGRFQLDTARALKKSPPSFRLHQL